MVTTGSLSFESKKFEFFSQNAWVMKFWSQLFEKKAGFWGKAIQAVLNVVVFRRASPKFAQFGLIYEKNAISTMDFEIHLATITTGSLSFDLKIYMHAWVLEI